MLKNRGVVGTIRDATIVVLVMIGICTLLTLISDNVFFFAFAGFLGCWFLMVLTLCLSLKILKHRE